MKKYFLLPLLVYYLVSNVQAQEKIKLSSPNGEKYPSASPTKSTMT